MNRGHLFSPLIFLAIVYVLSLVCLLPVSAGGLGSVTVLNRLAGAVPRLRWVPLLDPLVLNRNNTVRPTLEFDTLIVSGTLVVPLCSYSDLLEDSGACLFANAGYQLFACPEPTGPQYTVALPTSACTFLAAWNNTLRTFKTGLQSLGNSSLAATISAAGCGAPPEGPGVGPGVGTPPAGPCWCERNGALMASDFKVTGTSLCLAFNSSVGVYNAFVALRPFGNTTVPASLTKSYSVTTGPRAVLVLTNLPLNTTFYATILYSFYESGDLAFVEQYIVATPPEVVYSLPTPVVSQIYSDTSAVFVTFRDTALATAPAALLRFRFELLDSTTLATQLVDATLGRGLIPLSEVAGAGDPSLYMVYATALFPNTRYNLTLCAIMTNGSVSRVAGPFSSATLPAQQPALDPVTQDSMTYTPNNVTLTVTLPTRFYCQVLGYEVQLVLDSFPSLAWKSVIIPITAASGNTTTVTISYTPREARTLRWARAKARALTVLGPAPFSAASLVWLHRSESPQNNPTTAGGDKGHGTNLVPLVISLALLALIALLVILFMWRRRRPATRLHNLKEFEVDPRDVKLLHVIGGTAFSQLYRGELLIGGAIRPVTVKQRVHAVTRDEEVAFLRETEIAKQLKRQPHTNIVTMCAMVEVDAAAPLALVHEYCPLGSLHARLVSASVPGNEPLSQADLVRLATGIAAGMTHAASLGIVHGDLAARNVMLTADMVPKITNFEPKSASYFVAHGAATLAVRWMAPECLAGSQFFSEATDVFSFGVLLWELCSLGDKPFGPITDNEALACVLRGRRLVPPSSCPSPLQAMMTQCWGMERPLFAALSNMLVAFAAAQETTAPSPTALSAARRPRAITDPPVLAFAPHAPHLRSHSSSPLGTPGRRRSDAAPDCLQVFVDLPEAACLVDMRGARLSATDSLCSSPGPGPHRRPLEPFANTGGNALAELAEQHCKALNIYAPSLPTAVSTAPSPARVPGSEA
eukprot:m.132352 g.132352  ORF g.132352 m.132352 type:complete len:981 (-) comp14808_c0_seq5:218-3160(-)